MTNLFGYNVLSIPDKAEFFSHLHRLNPPAMLFFQNDLDTARQVKAEFPDMAVIVRHWPDSEIHKRMTPQQWIDAYQNDAQGGLYLQTTNESGLSQEVIAWHLQVMDLAVQRGIHLVLLNPATGTWDIPDFGRLKPLLIKASQHRDLFVIGLHEYAGGVITSGIAGGYPDNAGVQPGDPGGLNFIPPDKWPNRDFIMHTTTFHLGRHAWLMNYCESIGLSGDKMPRFGLTETGFDYLGDIGSWLNALDHAGYTGVNGYQTLKAQWLKWWGIQFETNHAKAYVEQFQYAAKNLLNGLEFALFFAYGDDGNWTNYNVASSGIPALLETVPDEPPAPAPEFDYGAMSPTILNVVAGYINLRAKPDIDSRALNQLSNGAAIQLSENASKSGEFDWYKVIYQGVTGFIADTQNWHITSETSKLPTPPKPDIHALIAAIRQQLDELEKLI